jgi:hypothetical protein
MTTRFILLNPHIHTASVTIPSHPIPSHIILHHPIITLKQVTYVIDAFLDKNRDVLSDDLRELLETSAAPLTRALADRGFMTEQVCADGDEVRKYFVQMGT